MGEFFFVGVLVKAPLFGVYIRAPEFWRLPYTVELLTVFRGLERLSGEVGSRFEVSMPRWLCQN